MTPRPCPGCGLPLTKLDRVRFGKPGPIRCGRCGYDLEHDVPESSRREDGPRVTITRNGDGDAT